MFCFDMKLRFQRKSAPEQIQFTPFVAMFIRQRKETSEEHVAFGVLNANTVHK